jgi:predicted HTH domain antitoxin
MSSQATIPKMQIVFAQSPTNVIGIQQFDIEKYLEGLKMSLSEIIRRQPDEEKIWKLQIPIGEFQNQLKHVEPTFSSFKELLKIFNNYQIPQKEETVLSMYEHGNISLGRAAELCNLKYDKMIDKLMEKGIKLKFGPENINEALEEEKKFRAKMKRS